MILVEKFSMKMIVLLPGDCAKENILHFSFNSDADNQLTKNVLDLKEI